MPIYLKLITFRIEERVKKRETPDNIAREEIVQNFVCIIIWPHIRKHCIATLIGFSANETLVCCFGVVKHQMKILRTCKFLHSA